jgi:hypothetical protein
MLCGCCSTGPISPASRRTEALAASTLPVHLTRKLSPHATFNHAPNIMVPRIPIRRTTVDIGRAFELHCLRFLTQQLYMSLTQVGGAGDGGVDLRGWWTVPSPSTPAPSSNFKLGTGTGSEMNSVLTPRKLRVLGQCKAERKALGPRIVRELEGVMAHQRGGSPALLCLIGFRTSFKCMPWLTS